MRGILELIALPEQEKTEIGLVHTAREIGQQPRLWQDTVLRVMDDLSAWKNWFDKIGLAEDSLQVIIAGAGTSYYAGVCLQPFWRQALNKPCEVWPTTRIVTEPATIISEKKPVLLVSLARSGNNPESIGSVKLVDQLSPRSYHLAITCNQDSFLGRLEQESDNARSLVLHPNSLDKGLAMTSSFTSLIVAGLMLAEAGCKVPKLEAMPLIPSIAETVLARSNELAAYVDDNEFDRTYIIGDGSLYGVAQEGVLKFEEFSDGHIMGLAETFLGSRHGNANVITDETLVVYLLASDRYVREYQLEVVKEISERRPAAKKLAVSLHNDNPELGTLVDRLFVLDESGKVTVPDELRAPLDTVILQCLSLQSSLKLNIPPDNPFRKRATAKAVEGLYLKPYHQT